MMLSGMKTMKLTTSSKIKSPRGLFFVNFNRHHSTLGEKISLSDIVMLIGMKTMHKLSYLKHLNKSNLNVIIKVT